MTAITQAPAPGHLRWAQFTGNVRRGQSPHTKEFSMEFRPKTSLMYSIDEVAKSRLNAVVKGSDLRNGVQGPWYETTASIENISVSAHNTPCSGEGQRRLIDTLDSVDALLPGLILATQEDVLEAYKAWNRVKYEVANLYTQGIIRDGVVRGEPIEIIDWQAMKALCDSTRFGGSRSF